MASKRPSVMAHDELKGDIPAAAILCRGITGRSLSVIFCALFLMGMVIQFGDVLENPIFRHEWSSHALALPAIMVFVMLSLVAGLVGRMTRRNWLSRPEMLCILFAMLLAAPIMGAGFWHMIVHAVSIVPKTAAFDKMDAVSDKLWPHGPNLVAGALEQANAPNLQQKGNVIWQLSEVSPGTGRTVVVVSNKEPGEISCVRIRVPLDKDDRSFLLLQEPYLVSALVRAREMGVGAQYYGRIHYDDQAEFAEEAFSGSETGQITFLQKQGFLRLGSYGITFPSSIKSHIELEFGLTGSGTVVFSDARLMSVGALENLYKGRRIIARSEYDRLPESERLGAREGNTALVVRPDHLLSLEGLRFLLTAYIPLEHWLQPMLAWGSFIFLLLLATFAVAVLMRRQWIDRERYPLPLAQITQALLGREGGDAKASSEIWRNRVMWLGFGLSLVWCLIRGWQAFNPNVPDMNIGFEIKPYLDNPRWGQAWSGVFFGVSAIFLALGVFMELNVLISLVLGFLLFRLQFAVGYNFISMAKSATGGTPEQMMFPFGPHQLVAAFMTYGVLTLIFTRKYLWESLRRAIRHDEPPAGEVFSSRTVLFLLGGCLLCFAGWARWVGIPLAGMLLFCGFLVLVGFVSAKLRAECGVPFGAWFPLKATVILPLLGGMHLFAPQGVMFITLAVTILMPFAMPAVFFLIPGLQIELVELGRRYRLPRRDVALTALVGVLGGLLIGGWVFLSSSYGVGGDNAGALVAYRGNAEIFVTYQAELKQSTLEMTGAAEATARQTDPATWAYAYAAVVTALVTVFRQLFSGFWFHPIGVILGPTQLMGYVWGSLLVAWIIRLVTVRLGGAVAVRTKLLPFFIGVFLAAVSAHAIFGMINGYLFFFSHGAVRPGGIF